MELVCSCRAIGVGPEVPDQSLRMATNGIENTVIKRCRGVVAFSVISSHMKLTSKKV